MKRRGFLKVLGLGAAAAPVAASEFVQETVHDSAEFQYPPLQAPKVSGSESMIGTEECPYEYLKTKAADGRILHRAVCKGLPKQA